LHPLFPFYGPFLLGYFLHEIFPPKRCLIYQDAIPGPARKRSWRLFMKLQALLFRSFLGKTALASLALGGFLFFAGAPAAKANPWQDCNRRVAYTNMRYHEAVERFGPYSLAARHWAFERHEAYANLARCRDFR
jgi:hypothetical protein